MWSEAIACAYTATAQWQAAIEEVSAPPTSKHAKLRTFLAMIIAAGDDKGLDRCQNRFP